MAVTTPASPCSFLKQQQNFQQDYKHAALFGCLEVRYFSMMLHADKAKKAAKTQVPLG